VAPVAAAVHFLCRVDTKPDLEFTTRRMSDARFWRDANRALSLKFLDGLTPKMRTTRGTLVTDFIPYVLWLLAAGDGSSSLSRPVSSLEILTKQEVKAFWAHVNIMKNLGLTYGKVKDFDNEETSTVFQLQPEIHRFVAFGNSMQLVRKQIPNELKELLTHETKMQHMRDKEKELYTSSAPVINDHAPATSAHAPISNNPNPAFASTTDPKRHRVAEAPAAVATEKFTRKRSCFLAIGAAKALALRTARKAARVNGFVDKRSPSKKIKLTHSGSGKPLACVVRYKYQKGFTQAIRVPCRMEDFI